MKQVKILLLSLVSSVGAFAAELDVSPGKLQQLLPQEGKGQSELKLKGEMDARDLAVFENLSGDVKSLDLSEVTIKAITTPSRQFFGRTLFNEGEIPAYTFFKSEVESLILPTKVNVVCEGAFAGSSIKRIEIPEGVTSLGDYAFYGCAELEEVVLPSSLRSLGKGAFANCISLKSVNLSNTAITEIPEKAFSGAIELESVSIPTTVSAVGREAFSHTAISSLSLPNVRNFEDYALSSMPFLTELSINPDARVSDGLLMDNISLSSLSGMPEVVPDYFAANCGSLPTETINRASSAGKYSFANTQAPSELILSGFIERIDRGALSGLANITRIDVTALEDRVPVVDETTFEGLNQPDIVLWVADEAFDLWENDPVWRLFQVTSTNQTGIEDITADDPDSQIEIAFTNGRIKVTSPAVVADVRIYTADGRMAYVASPDRESVEIEADQLPSGILIVIATDGAGSSKNVSILK